MLTIISVASKMRWRRRNVCVRSAVHGSPRSAVGCWNLVWENHRPAGAYALLDGLKPEHPSAAPPTVYRALEFLLDHGLVHRIQSLNAFVGCADPEHAHRGLFLICDACGDAVEIEDSEIDRAVAKSATQLGFTLKSRTIEATGLCRQCAPD